MNNKQTSPQGEGEAACTLAELIYRCDHTVESVASGLSVNQLIVQDWICGIVPPAEKCIKLAELLGCSLTSVYTAILVTPKIIEV